MLYSFTLIMQRTALLYKFGTTYVVVKVGVFSLVQFFIFANNIYTVSFMNYATK